MGIVEIAAGGVILITVVWKTGKTIKSKLIGSISSGGYYRDEERLGGSVRFKDNNASSKRPNC